MVYRAVRQGLATPGEISEVAASLGSVRGRRALVATVAAAAAGSESFLETVALRTVFVPKEFAGFIRQHRLRADGVSYRLDMYDPATRTAVELDGAIAHEGTGHRARDVRRDARLASIGIVTLRFVYRDLTERPAWCREMVVRTIARRGAARVGMSADSDAAHPFEWA
jgi:very-short-patch-repair endonuclease